MATLTVVNSFGSVALPLRNWPGLDRLDGAGAKAASFAILDGPLAGGRILLAGSGFTYDAQELPAGGTVTSLTIQRPGDFATVAVLDGFGTGAAGLRAATDLWTLLMAGGDTLTGGSGGDRLVGHDGNDLISGGHGHDRLEGGAGADTLIGGKGNNVLIGGAGDDLLVMTDSGKDIIRGGLGDDRIQVTSTDPSYRYVFDGGGGTDVIVMTGSQFSSARLEHATMLGIETLRFEAPGYLWLAAEHLATIEQVELAWDAASAPGARAKLVVAGGGVVSLDAFELTGAPELGLELQIAASTGDLTTIVFGRTIASGRPDDVVLGSSGGDYLYLSEGNDSAEGFGARDDMRGEEGNDSLLGGWGNDNIEGGEGNDSLDGGGDDDNILGGDGADTLDGGAGSDALYAGGGNDALAGGDGADTLDGDTGADTMAGGAGDDLYKVNEAGDVVVESGGSGRDLVWTSVGYVLPANVEDVECIKVGIAVTGNALGNAMEGAYGAETLNGAGGADTIDGAGGADRLTGGTGADVFDYTSRYASGVAAGTRDLVTDFNRAQGDRIRLTGMDANADAGGEQNFTSFGAWVLNEAVAAGSIRWTQANGLTLVYGYVDSLAGADFVIEVSGMGPALSADFLF